MSNEFEQISIKPGFMKHNGGVLFRTISETEYEFKTTINENHLNAAGITHGGYLSALIDAGAGTAAHRASGNAPCVTISLDLKFIGASKIGDEIITKDNCDKYYPPPSIVEEKVRACTKLHTDLCPTEFEEDGLIKTTNGIWKINAV